MLALVLMALKEYAKEAIGLTEQDLVFSGWSSEAGDRHDACNAGTLTATRLVPNLR